MEYIWVEGVGWNGEAVGGLHTVRELRMVRLRSVILQSADGLRKNQRPRNSL